MKKAGEKCTSAFLDFYISDILYMTIKIKKKGEKMLNLKEKSILASRYYRYFDAFMKIGLSTLPRKMIPILKFSEKENTYSDGGNSIIVIGLENPLYKACQDENDFIWITQYLLGHEMQHVLSTTEIAWKWGISQGTRLVCQEISKQIEGPNKRRFLKESDYNYFVKDMQDKGILISLQQIQTIIHFIQNSLCDGRIERLRAIKRPGFRKLMIAGRGYIWKETPIQIRKAYEDLSAEEKLSIKLNQILSLATTSLYMKDFLETYMETPLKEDIDNFIPIIAKGVKSSNCLKCMKQAIEIDKMLIPEIIEVCKLDRMNEILQNLPIPSNDASYKGSSVTEECGAENEDGNDNNDNNKKKDDTSTSKKHIDSDPNGNVKDETKDSEELKDSDQVQSVKNDWGINAGKRNIGDTSSIELSDEMINRLNEEIEKIIKEAAETAKENTSAICSSIAVQKIEKETPDNSVPTTAEGVAEKYSESMHFEEKHRMYDLSYPLPFELAGRAEKFTHDIEKLLHNQQEPYVRGRMSGMLDSGKLSKLLMKQGDFYKKQGKIPEFNGCGYILMDNSGSMGNGRGSKREYACEAMAIIEEGFKRYMPVKITAFDACSNNFVLHEVIKGFDEKMNASCSYNFFMSGRSGNGNKDGFSIRIATKELLGRSEKEKLLVVASDGTPSCYQNYVGGMADVRDAVNEARKAGIKVVGIFFADDVNDCKEAKEFQSMYQFDCVCTVPEMIEDELTKVMTRFMFG